MSRSTKRQARKWAAWQVLTYVIPCLVVAQVIGGDLTAKVGRTNLPVAVFAVICGLASFLAHRIRSWWVGGPEAACAANA